MIGVDTNVLLRLLVVDDAVQNAKAKAFFAERTAQSPAYVGAIVLAETVWVLRRTLGFSKGAVEQLIRQMLRSPEIEIEDGSKLRALISYEDSPKTDIADFLVAWAAERGGCTRTVTFDVRSAKAIPSMQLLS